jgi:hypothetical protein
MASKAKKAAVPAAPMKEPEAFVKPKKAVEKPKVEILEKPKELPVWMKDDAPSTNETDKGMCMSMWQPWAGLVISGAKRLEGRVWKSDFRGRLWIHAASKSLEEDERLEIEENILQANPDAKIPTSYPQSCLLGCIDVIDMISHEELLQRREAYERLLAEGIAPAPHVEYYIHEENESDYAFVCLRPKQLTMPLAMSGEHKIYQLPKNIHDAAKAQLSLLGSK